MSNLYLSEPFTSDPIDPRLSWFCPPPVAQTTPAGLYVETAADSDFWQRTHYGFQRDNGHFLYTPVTGDFILTTHVAFSSANKYDQSGLMVRLSPEDWIKTSIEYDSDRLALLGAVVTNLGWSDWSTQAVSPATREISLRIRCEGSDYRVEALLVEPGGTEPAWSMLREAHLHRSDSAGPIQAGLYACSPTAAGYQASFKFLKIELGRLD